MKVDFEDDEYAVLDAFDKSVAAVSERTAADDIPALATEISRHGWLEIAGQHGAGSNIPLLAGCAERLGRREHPLQFPLVESWVAIRLLEALPDVRTDLVESITSGERVVTVATDLLGGNDTGGSSGYIPNAAAADLVLLPLRRADGATAVHLVETSHLPLIAVHGLDPSLKPEYVERLELEADTSIGVVDSKSGATLSAELLVMLAAETVGAAEWLFDQTVQFLKTREQFGRALSSFQALQHRVADLGLRIQAARSLTIYASWAAGRVPDQLRVAWLAKGYAGECGLEVAADAIQLHGGQGFTVEMGLHHNALRIMHRSLTGLQARQALVRAGAYAVAHPEVLGSPLPEDLRPTADWLAAAGEL